jgi:hypothetical protein
MKNYIFFYVSFLSLLFLPIKADDLRVAVLGTTRRDSTKGGVFAYESTLL